MLKGVICRSTGSWYEVRLENGDFVKSRIKGKFRMAELKTSNPVAVGDNVLLEMEKDNTGVINDILPRDNYLIRRSPQNPNMKSIVASNLDMILLLASLHEPRTSTGFIDRILLTAAAYHIPAVILFNKIDLYGEEEMEILNEYADIYEEMGIKCLQISVKYKKNIDQLESVIKDKVALVTGHSGVGKSSLINMLDPQKDIRTDEISEWTGKGKHTTTYAEMHPIHFGGWIIDTPGIKEFGVVDLKVSEIGAYFPDFVEFMPHCKFQDCIHINEPECGVKDAVEHGAIDGSRYLSYLSIIDEVQNAKADWE